MTFINRRQVFAGALALLSEARLSSVFASQQTEHASSNSSKAGSAQMQNATYPAHAGETLLDLWDQAPRITVVHGVSADPFQDFCSRQKIRYQNPRVKLRFDKFYVGAFSIQLLKSAAPSKVTFLSSVWNHNLVVSTGSLLEFWLSPLGTMTLPESVGVIIVAASRASVTATAKPAGVGGEWTRYTAALPALKAGDEFVSAVTLDLSQVLEHDDILIDGVGFRTAGRFTGVTDKPLQNWIEEAANTRSERVRQAFEEGAKTDSGIYREWFDKLWLGRDVAEANSAMRKFLQTELIRTKQGQAEFWDLVLNVRLIETYYELGRRSGRRSAPLEPETEELLLEVLWERTKHENDIGWASSDTWWLTGSENHDLNAKVSCLVTSRIFMNEPRYRNRLYPDEAQSPGYGYWFGHKFTGQIGYGPETAASWKPSGQHTPAEHYKAWVAFFNRYVTERAERGFFLERAAPGYMRYTLDFLYTLYQYSGDKSLQHKVGNFLDLVWADWAQEQIAGIRGGPKTRHHHTVGGYDAMTDMSRFLLGGPGTTVVADIYTALLLYQRPLPPVVFALAIDTRGRGRYALASRGVGEEEASFPRPQGTEKTLTVDTDSRLLKYSWVTPDYILGTQMDHPLTIESHLSSGGRWHGLIVAGSPETRIVPTGGASTFAGKPEIDMERMYQTAQDKNVLIVQQARRWMQVSPGWYPSSPIYEKPISLYVGKAWDDVVERSGWIFFRHQGAYAAVRIIAGEQRKGRDNALGLMTDVLIEGAPYLIQPAETPWAWSSDKTAIQLNDIFSPMIIYAGSKGEDGTFDAFQETVLKSRLELHATVVPGYYYLVFQGAKTDAREIQFPANTPGVPLIDGEAIDYRPDDLFSGPFIQSKYKSGRLRIKYGSNELLLNFENGKDKA